jgi:stage II sporulation protein M
MNLKKSVIISLVIAAFFFIAGALIKNNTEFVPCLSPEFKEIYLNNLLLQISVIVFSLITFGLVSAVYLSYQFAILGCIVRSATEQYSLKFALVYLLPHGIIEIPSIILSSTIGIFLPHYIISVIKGRNNFRPLLVVKPLCINIVLILLAALIETYFSPIIIAIINKGG